MVNWQESDAAFRLLAAIFADPSFKPDVNFTAKLFGRGATSYAVNHQFQKIRRASKELIAEAEKNGVQLSATPRAAAPRTPRTSRVQSGGVAKPGASSKARGGGGGGSTKHKGLDTPTKTGKGTGGLSMIDAIAVDTDNESVISVTKSDTMSIQGGVPKEEIGDDDTAGLKREVDLTTPEPQPTPLQLFGQRPAPPRVDSRSNGYVLGSGERSAANAYATSDFSVNDIFGNYD